MTVDPVSADKGIDTDPLGDGPDGHALDASAGVFHQQLPATLLVQRKAAAGLLEPRALHFVRGYRRLLTPDTKLSIEVCEKEYDRMPLDPARLRPGIRREERTP